MIVKQVSDCMRRLTSVRRPSAKALASPHGSQSRYEAVVIHVESARAAGLMEPHARNDNEQAKSVIANRSEQ